MSTDKITIQLIIHSGDRDWTKAEIKDSLKQKGLEQYYTHQKGYWPDGCIYLELDIGVQEFIDLCKASYLDGVATAPSNVGYYSPLSVTFMTEEPPPYTCLLYTSPSPRDS